MDTYSLEHIPFSIAGSFLTIIPRNQQNSHRLLYRTTSAKLAPSQELPYKPDEFLEIALLQSGNEVSYTWMAQPTCLTLSTESGGSLRFIFVSVLEHALPTKAISLA